MTTPEYPQHQPPGQQPPYPPQGNWRAYPPQGPPPRKRHRLRTVVIATLAGIGALVVIGVIAAALAGPSHPQGHTAAIASTVTTGPATPASSAPAPAPTANPSGTISGSCDVSLSDTLNGQNYLTASVTANNTGNVGTIVRIRVAWPLQGFPPVTRTRTIRTKAGASKQLQFHAPVTESQVSQFQDIQLAASGDPCHYHATITGTYGQPSG